MSLSRIFFIVVMTWCSVSASSKLGGRIDDMTLGADGNPYIVTDNIIIPENKKLVIGQGCVLLFKPFTGIIVDGSLEIKGNSSNPVTFTSENDTKFNKASTQFPNPFDWNGVLINQTASEVHLSYLSIKYSVFGLKSFKADIHIENGLFSHNGQSNLSINEVMKNVAEDIPFSYQPEDLQVPRQSPDRPDTIKTTTQSVSPRIDLNPPRHVSPKKIIAISCVVAGAACLGGTAYFYSQAIDYQNKYQDAVDIADINRYRSQRDSKITSTWICGIPTVLFTAGATVFFALNHREKQHTVSLLPSIGESNGLTLSIIF